MELYFSFMRIRACSGTVATKFRLTILLLTLNWFFQIFRLILRAISRPLTLLQLCICEVSGFRTGAANVTVLVGYDALSLGNWFMTSYTSVLVDAMTLFSLDVGNQVIVDAASCLNNATLLFFIDHSMYNERSQRVLEESSNYQRHKQAFKI